MGYSLQKDDVKIKSNSLSSSELRELVSFFEFNMSLSSRGFSIKDIEKEYDIGALRKVYDDSSNVRYYNKYEDETGNIIYIFYEPESLFPCFILDFNDSMDIKDSGYDNSREYYKKLISRVDID